MSIIVQRLLEKPEVMDKIVEHLTGRDFKYPLSILTQQPLTPNECYLKKYELLLIIDL